MIEERAPHQRKRSYSQSNSSVLVFNGSEALLQSPTNENHVQTNQRYPLEILWRQTFVGTKKVSLGIYIAIFKE